MLDIIIAIHIFICKHQNALRIGTTIALQQK